MSKMPGEMVNAPEEFKWFTLTHPNGREIHVSGTDRYDYSQQHWTQTCYERWDKPEGDLVRPPWELTLRYTMPQDMESILHYNDFKIVAKYAEYDGTPGTEEKPANVFICEKC
jgi:hypothetical protein